MDALYPRLIADRFAESFRFYEAVLPPLLGAKLIKGSADGPYANWDAGAEAVLVLMDRALAAGLAAPGGPGDRAMFVSRVTTISLDEAYALCLRHGATSVAEPVDRPQWGPGLRTAHVRDPEGNLWELQTY